MATINRNAPGFFDGAKASERRVVAYTGPASYATGGDSFTAEECSLGAIRGIMGLTISNGSALLWGYYNTTTKKILWYSATGTEFTNASSLAAYTGVFEVIGR